MALPEPLVGHCAWTVPLDLAHPSCLCRPRDLLQWQRGPPQEAPGRGASAELFNGSPRVRKTQRTLMPPQFRAGARQHSSPPLMPADTCWHSHPPTPQRPTQHRSVPLLTFIRGHLRTSDDIVPRGDRKCPLENRPVSSQPRRFPQLLHSPSGCPGLLSTCSLSTHQHRGP